MRPAAGFSARRMAFYMNTNHNDSDDNVIDVDFSCAKQKARRKSRKRTALILFAALLVVVLVVGTVIFFQVDAATEDKNFWQNFNSGSSERG